jgi:hypothetical protein
MPRRTRKELVEAMFGNEDAARTEREEEYRTWTYELHQEWQAGQAGPPMRRRRLPSLTLAALPEWPAH